MKPSACHISRFSVEFQLACACCRVKPTEQDWANIHRLLPLINVPAFVDLVVSRHRIGPLVHNALSQLPVHALPDGLLEPLTQEAKANSLKALRAVRTNVLLDRWFRDADIRWLPFKGSTVAQRYYGNVSLRQVNDQDVWVHADQLDEARAVLSEHGFQWDPKGTCWDLASRGPNHKAFLLRYHYEEQHISAEHGRIELHWQLTDNPEIFKITPDELLARATRTRMASVDLATMNDVDLLLYLCEHGGRHCWYRLKWLSDLPQLLEQRAWDWVDLFNRAQELGCTRSLQLGLSLAGDLFGWQAPPVVISKMQGAQFQQVLLSTVHRGLCAPSSWWSSPAPRPPLQWQLSSILSRSVLAANASALRHVLWRLTLSPNDLRVLALPDRMFWLYRLSRFFLLTHRRLRQAFLN